MPENLNKQTYRSPRITRVVLKRDQAILSVCSGAATVSHAAGSFDTCVAFGCRKKASGGDSTDPS